jgi:hypothetical protein
LDAEEATLRVLAGIREAIVDGLGKAPNLNALRRLLHEVFSAIEYFEGWVSHRPRSEQWHL